MERKFQSFAVVFVYHFNPALFAHQTNNKLLHFDCSTSCVLILSCCDLFYYENHMIRILGSMYAAKVVYFVHSLLVPRSIYFLALILGIDWLICRTSCHYARYEKLTGYDRWIDFHVYWLHTDSRTVRKEAIRISSRLVYYWFLWVIFWEWPATAPERSLVTKRCITPRLLLLTIDWSVYSHVIPIYTKMAMMLFLLADIGILMLLLLQCCCYCFNACCCWFCCEHRRLLLLS